MVLKLKTDLKTKAETLIKSAEAKGDVLNQVGLAKAKLSSRQLAEVGFTSEPTSGITAGITSLLAVGLQMDSKKAGAM